MLSQMLSFLMTCGLKGKYKMFAYLLVITSIFLYNSYSQDLMPLSLGCYEDQNTRDLPRRFVFPSNNTPKYCAERCSSLSYSYAGVQFSTECFCGNTYGRYGKRPHSECNMTCSGNSKITCGNAWRNEIYCIVPFYKEFLGCYLEGTPSDLWGLETTGDIKQCREVCLSKGFSFAAVQNNNRCTCGVSYGRYGKADPFACDCKGNNAVYKAGGTWKMAEVFYGNSKQSLPLVPRHVIYTETSVDKLYLCASYCETSVLCKSINYNHVTHVCEMNNVTSSEGNSKERNGFEYYEPVGQIFSLKKHDEI